MKKLCLVLSFALSALVSSAQLPDVPGNNMVGGLGMTVIDGKSYFLLNTAPEFSFSDWGVGLDLNLRIDTDGKIRKADFDEGYDFLRLIRYVRYGQKRAPLYFRVGALDAARIGHGLLMYNYSNSISYDNRKVGLEFDMKFDSWGFETMTSNFFGAELFGGRFYYLPLSESGIPLIRSLEFGSSFVTDLSEDGRKLQNGSQPLTLKNYDKSNPVTAAGVDVGLPILDNAFLDLGIYSEFGKILGYGQGASFGVETNLKGLGSLFSVSGKFEHRINGDQFLPNYFGPFYEIERFSRVKDSVYTSKLQQLEGIKSPGNGLYGSLQATILGTVKILGSYEELYRLKNSGMLHLGTDMGDIIPFAIAKADYYRRGIKAGELFKLDEKSILTAEAGYRPYQYLIISMFYQWTFVPVKSGGDIVRYETVYKVEPKVSFVFRF